MKVEVNEKAKREEDEYPCLMIEYSGMIVLFSGYSIGTVLNETHGWKPGEFSDGWDMDCFKPFHGTITLSNE